MNPSIRLLLRAAPFAAVAAIVFLLTPHASDDKGIAPPAWPAWGWFDVCAMLIVWIGTAVMLNAAEHRRGRYSEDYPDLDESALELAQLATAALQATALYLVFCGIRWLLPSSGPAWSRGKGMSWLSWDASEYQFVVALWAASFLYFGYRALLDETRAARRRREASAQAPPPARATRQAIGVPPDGDAELLRHALLEASVGRRVALPEALRDHRVAQLIEAYFTSGERARLDEAAAELTGDPVQPWMALAHRPKR